MKQRGSMLRYDYDYKIVRGVIAGADFCLAMKHHPIVFGMGNSVPCVAVSVDEYYRHKNGGALALFGMQGWMLSGDAIFDSRAENMFGRMIAQRGALAAEIGRRLSGYNSQDGDAIAASLKTGHNGENS